MVVAGRDTTAPPDFDATSLLANFENDVSDIRTLVNMVLGSLPGYIRDLHSAAKAKDARRVATLAHTIGGSVGNVYAVRLGVELKALEDTARSGAMPSDDVLDLVERVATDLVSSLTRWTHALEGASTPAASRR
jgi:HPt (histidine-containing phosphotransfer) domain-containing protein